MQESAVEQQQQMLCLGYDDADVTVHELPTYLINKAQPDFVVA